METLAALPTLLFVATITPGPNNLLVFRIAARSGVLAALPAIGGVIAGGLVMLALMQFGFTRLVAANAWLRDAIVLAGAGYLGWMGFGLLLQRVEPVAVVETAIQPTNGSGRLFLLQFVNPKAWALFLAVAALAQAAMPGVDSIVSFLLIFALFAVISATCLFAWALLGRLAARGIRHESKWILLDRAMGMLLIGMAAMLLLNDMEAA